MENDWLRRLNRIVWPPEVLSILNRIDHLGYRAYVVGGAVRNHLWECATHDFDLATNLPQNVLTEWYGDRHPGWRFGMFWAAPHVEIAVMRTEWGYADRRHPDGVQPVDTIEEDLTRRDFSVNAIAIGIRHAAWVPEAVEDIKLKRLRAVGDPYQRFSEDPLRILRLVRLMARYEAQADLATWEAARGLNRLGRKVSRERRLNEWVKFLSAPIAQWPLWHQAGLLEVMEWPDVTWEGEIFEPTTELTRAYLFLRRLQLPRGFVEDWVRRWPLPRPWKKTLLEAFRQDDPLNGDYWAWRARQGGSTHAFWAHLARAAGMTDAELQVARLALPIAQLAQEAGIHGREIGHLHARIRDAIAYHPDWNTPSRLRQLAGIDPKVDV